MPLSEAGLVDITPGDGGLADVGPAEVGPAEVGPAEVGIVEVGLAEFGLAEVGPAEVGPAEVGPDEVGIVEVGPAEVGPDEVGIVEVGIDENGPGEVGHAEVGIAENGPAEVDTRKRQPGKVHSIPHHDLKDRHDGILYFLVFGSCRHLDHGRQHGCPPDRPVSLSITIIEVKHRNTGHNGGCDDTVDQQLDQGNTIEGVKYPFSAPFIKHKPAIPFTAAKFGPRWGFNLISHENAFLSVSEGEAWTRDPFGTRWTA